MREHTRAHTHTYTLILAQVLKIQITMIQNTVGCQPSDCIW